MFLNVLFKCIYRSAIKLTQSCDKQFHLSTIWLLKVYFLKPTESATFLEQLT